MADTRQSRCHFFNKANVKAVYVMDAKPKILTVVQARSTSTRLPKKVLLPVLGKPVLVQMYERLQRAKKAGKIIVATTWCAEDDALVEICNQHQIECFRGHPDDCLDRHYQAMIHYGVDTVVKIPSDCPLIDPQIVDRVISAYEKNPKTDYVSNLHPPTYPDGNDVEVIRSEALTKAWKEAKRQIDREHTTPYFWDNPSIFKVANVVWEKGLDFSQKYRLVLDYSEDYELIKKIFEALYPQNPEFALADILNFLDSHPDVYKINQRWLGDCWQLRQGDQLQSSPLERA